jgi:hypothetical protein
MAPSLTIQANFIASIDVRDLNVHRRQRWNVTSFASRPNGAKNEERRDSSLKSASPNLSMSRAIAQAPPIVAGRTDRVDHIA